MAGLKRGLPALWLALSLAWAAWVPHPAWGDTPPAAPAMLLAEVYAADVDVTRYWVSEKFDGVRAQWDGRSLRFRGGGRVPAPAWFTADFPAVPLDGELWIARGQFDALSGMVRKLEPVDAEWRQVRYLVFELPGAAGTFSERVRQMQAMLGQAGVPWLQAVEQFRVTDQRALTRRLAAVVKAGGEGLMLHHAAAPYETGRSQALLKLKQWLDAEATVIAHLPGRGKYAGMLGTLRVRTSDGREFAIGTGFSDAQRRDPPPLGATVTYRYRELTAKGLPRHASFWRVREEP
jgi:DNA ligase-1